VTKHIDITLKIWRQNGPDDSGKFDAFPANHVSTDMSFLEMIDQVNEELILAGKDPIAIDSDCREGICGMCGAMVNGRAHGPEKATTLCQLHVRMFSHGDTVVVEPFRSRAFKIHKDLVMDRSVLDQIIQAGGYISANTGASPDANTIPVSKEAADKAMDAAACIGCGACVASCPNSSAMLFVGAKVSHLALLPQGKPEAARRVLNMVRQMDQLGFGNCGNEKECEAACPKEISIANIARLNREYIKSAFFSSEK